MVSLEIVQITLSFLLPPSPIQAPSEQLSAPHTAPAPSPPRVSPLSRQITQKVRRDTATQVIPDSSPLSPEEECGGPRLIDQWRPLAPG